MSFLSCFFQSRSSIKQQEKPDHAAGKPETYGVFPGKQAPENHYQNKGNFPAAWPPISLAGVKSSQPANHLPSSGLKIVRPTLKSNFAPVVQDERNQSHHRQKQDSHTTIPVQLIPGAQDWKTGILRMLLPKSSKAAARCPAQSSSHSKAAADTISVPAEEIKCAGPCCQGQATEPGECSWRGQGTVISHSTLLEHFPVLSPHLSLEALHPRAPGPCFSWDMASLFSPCQGIPNHKLVLHQFLTSINCPINQWTYLFLLQKQN